MISLRGSALFLAFTTFLCPAQAQTPAARSSGGASVEARAAHLELARQDRPYLVLDADAGTLTLYHGGAVLRVWSSGGLSAGARRIPMGRGEALEEWRKPRVWTGGRSDPKPRMERRVTYSEQATPPDPSGAVEWIPPLPEESVPAPERFVLRYAEGLGVEVVASDHPGAGVMAATASAFRRFWHALRPWQWDRYRIRVVMETDDVGTLFRALPPELPLLTLLP